MKIQPLFELGMFSNNRIHATLKKYLLDTIVFTGEYGLAPDGLHYRWEIDTSCDAYIFHATPGGDSYRKLLWGDKDWVIRLLEEVERNPNIILFEAHNPMVMYPEWVKDKDVIQSYSLADNYPEHLNLITYPMPGSGRWIDEDIFHRKEEIDKDEGRILVSKDQLKRNLYETMFNFGNPLHVLGAGNQSFLGHIRDNDTYSIIYPEDSDKLNDLYNTMDYAVNFQPVGFESWLVEARFCGVKCYYPDSPHWRSIFGDENVGFFDLEDIEGTLNLENDMTESDIAYSRQKWGAEHRVPIFWEEIRNRITPEHSD